MIAKILLVSFLAFSSLNCSKKIQPSEFHILKLKTLKNLENSGMLYVPPDHKNLSLQLKSVNYDDQFYRDIKNPRYYIQNRHKQDILDKKNLAIVTKILDDHGYLSIKEVGYLANHGINLTLEHAPYSIKLKYMPIIDSAFRQKKLDAGVYTIYKDKMAVKEKRLQEYGTQIIIYKNNYTYFPLDIKKSDSCRKQIGLKQDLKTYLKVFFNSSFDSLEYERQLPSLKKLFDIKEAKTY